VTTTHASSEALGDQVSALRGVADEVLGSVSTIAERFDTHSRTLNDAARHVTDANRSAEAALDERRRALDELTGVLNQRSEALDTAMGNFAQLVGESLRSAEERALQVGRVLAENAASSVKQVMREFEELNATASSEGERAASSIRAANRAVVEELTVAMRQAVTQFEEATGAMRRAAQGMQDDLDKTREAIQRGMIELPAETRDTANEMRRVVGDQIKALAELSAIVGKNSQSYDILAPSGAGPLARNGAGRAAPAPEPSRPPAESRRAAPETRPSAEVTPRPPAPPAPRPTVATRAPARSSPAAEPRRTTPQPPVARDPARPGTVRPQPPRPAGPTLAPSAIPPNGIPNGTNDGTGANSGWMSNLLRRASLEVEAAAANGAGKSAPAATRTNGVRKQTEALSSLSRDIARHRSSGRHRPLGPLPPRREEPLQPAALHAAGPADLRRGPPPLSA
jgi:ABC-type transporter Mla subunit MlaD